jgi:hypothetical protein
LHRVRHNLGHQSHREELLLRLLTAAQLTFSLRSEARGVVVRFLNTSLQVAKRLFDRREVFRLERLL